MKKILIVLMFLFVSTFVNAKDISVSILPQKYIVQKIVGDNYNINVMVSPGFSPATYEPKASQMRDLVKSELYFFIGVPFENVWLERFKQNAKNTTFVDTTIGIEKLAMAKHTHGEEEHDDHKGHDHGKEKHEKEDHDEHEHEGLDPHVWLDPILVKIQAQNIYDAVVKNDASNESFYKTNLENFLKELDELNVQINDILKDSKDKAFMVFHPSWGYFAKRYDLEQIAIEVEGKEPKPNEIQEMIKDAKLHNIKVVFVAPQFSQKSAKTISKNLNANVVTINPLSLDWDKELINTAKEIANSYR